MSSLIFISGRGLAGSGLADLRDLVAIARGVLVTLRLDRLVEFGLELRQALVEGLAGGDAVRDLAGVRASLVHGLEHRLEQAGEMVVTGRAAKAPALLEILLGEPARLALGIAGRLRVQGGLEEKVRQREAARIGHSFRLRASFAKVHLVYLV